MTDMGIQEPLKTSEEVNEVRFVGRHRGFVRPSKKWTSGKLYTNTVLEMHTGILCLPYTPSSGSFLEKEGSLAVCTYSISTPLCD